MKQLMNFFTKFNTEILFLIIDLCEQSITLH